jgi:hypothetical protein
MATFSSKRKLPGQRRILRARMECEMRAHNLARRSRVCDLGNNRVRPQLLPRTSKVRGSTCLCREAKTLVTRTCPARSSCACRACTQCKACLHTVLLLLPIHLSRGRRKIIPKERKKMYCASRAETLARTSRSTLSTTPHLYVSSYRKYYMLLTMLLTEGFLGWGFLGSVKRPYVQLRVWKTL